MERKNDNTLVDRHIEMQLSRERKYYQLDSQNMYFQIVMTPNLKFATLSVCYLC